MRYIESPEECSGAGSEPILFLAGGITGCPDWQQGVVKSLSDTDITLLNPRRRVWLIESPEAAEEQIRWEHRHLMRADAILFWFPCATLCPITLYELGAWLCRPKTLFIGHHPDYRRSLDVRVQATMERPTLRVVSTLDALAEQVKDWVKNKNTKTF